MTTVEAADSSRLEGLPESLELYRQGLADAPLVAVTVDGKGGPGSTRAGGEASLPEDEMTFVISTDEVDRHGDIIVADGWRLDAYRRNPVVLWAHDYHRPVVGRTLAMWPEAAADEPGVHRLLARIRFAPTPFACEMASLYRGGYQRGVSVGFKPLVFEERRDGKTGAFLGIRFLEQELLEVSLVPVPANRSSLRRADSASGRRLAPAGSGGLGRELAGLLREAMLGQRRPGMVSGSGLSAGELDTLLGELRQARR